MRGAEVPRRRAAPECIAPLAINYRESTMKKTDDPTSRDHCLAHLETLDGQSWNSLHLTSEDAGCQLSLIAEEWGIGFTLDGEPADGFRAYWVDRPAVLTSEEARRAAGGCHPTDSPAGGLPAPTPVLRRTPS